MSLDDTSISDASSDQFNSAQPDSRPEAQIPSWGAKRCPSCYSVVLHNQIVCAECGTRLVPRLTRVRCLRCSRQATTDHVICPHCGRNLRAAPSRAAHHWRAPALLLGALAIALVARGMPSFLQENESLPLLQNFVITPASSDSEPTVRLAAREPGARGSSKQPRPVRRVASFQRGPRRCRDLNTNANAGGNKRSSQRVTGCVLACGHGSSTR